MTLNHKNNHTDGIIVFKLVKNEILHKILGLFCQKLKIQDGRWRPFRINANKHMVSPPQMPVPLKHMYNANIPRAEITTFVPSCPPM